MGKQRPGVFAYQVSGMCVCARALWIETSVGVLPLMHLLLLSHSLSSTAQNIQDLEDVLSYVKVSNV
jgi:hypothetical protein